MGERDLELTIIRGTLESWMYSASFGDGDGSGDGDGYSSGFGDGSGYGSGYGYGYGYGDGDGYGYGSGSGYGSGYGYGDGYGYGYGDGDGDGSGSGYGDGSGYGYGYGDGSGYGYGYGDGYGYGSGYGDGYGSGYGDGYWLALALPLLQKADQNAFIGFWRSNSAGLPSNGGRAAAPVSAGIVQETDGPLEICCRGFHATVDPGKWKGERLWLVELHGEIQHQEDKFAALKRRIVAEI